MEIDLAKKMKKLREDKGWSQLKASKKVGVSSSTYRDWEAGGRAPAGALVKLAQAFEISISELLGKKQQSNIHLAEALSHFEQGIESVKKALVHL